MLHRIVYVWYFHGTVTYWIRCNSDVFCWKRPAFGCRGSMHKHYVTLWALIFFNQSVKRRQCRRNTLYCLHHLEFKMHMVSKWEKKCKKQQLWCKKSNAEGVQKLGQSYGNYIQICLVQILHGLIWVRSLDQLLHKKKTFNITVVCHYRGKTLLFAVINHNVINKTAQKTGKIYYILFLPATKDFMFPKLPCDMFIVANSSWQINAVGFFYD